MGWASKRNGDLLRAAVAAGFEAFVAIDRKLQRQQNLSTFNIAVVVLEAKSNTLVDLRPLMPKVIESLSVAKRGEALVVRRVER